MRSIDRVRNIIAGKSVDHLPAQPMVMMFASKYAGIPFIDYTKDGRLMAEAQLRTVEDFDLDCLLTCSDPARELIDIAGEGSVEWFSDQGPAINESRAALTDKSLLKTFKIPDPTGGGRMHDRINGIEIMYKHALGEISIVGWIEGPLALAAELRGINNIMVDMLDDTPFVDDLLDFCTEVAIKYASPQIEAGADTIGMSDAAASMMGSKLYERFLFPRQKRVLTAIKEKHPETITRLHMCGNTDVLIPKMSELPVDIYELDFPADLSNARSILGPNKLISGNVSTVYDLLEYTPEQVYESARRCHQACGKRHIVNSGCEVSPLTPPDNLKSLIRYSRENNP
ncbi:MAG: uroporphyrinogen decarboxylase family protein [Ignavibacteriaceae bacterium]